MTPPSPPPRWPLPRAFALPAAATALLRWPLPRALALPAAATALLAATGCTPAQDYDAKPVLDDLVHVVILPTLETSATRSADLSTAAKSLSDAPTEASLTAAQDAWRSAREPWRNADGFAFGPVETNDFGASIDWNPAKPEIIEEKIAAGTSIDSAYIDSLGTSAKGFMALEYLLFDPTGDNAAVVTSLTGDPAASRRAYLAALAENLAGKTATLETAWAEDGGNFAAEVTGAGDTSKTFISGKAAIDELVNQMVFHADALLNTRIAKPAGKLDGGTPVPDAEESPRSDNSLADMLSSLAGIQNIYDGTFSGADGLGISDLVRAKNPDLDDRVHKAFADAKAKIEAIPPPFRTAVTDHPADVDAAYESALTLKRTLATEVVGVLGATLRFNDADGD
ncbi:MAG: imelysin family protein [Polyangiaceae bacterium]